MMVVPLLSNGQSGTPVFFNKGKMSVVGADTTKTVLYVAGDFIASRDASDATIKSDIYLKGSKTVILGDFYQDAYLDEDATPVLANVFRLSDADYYTNPLTNSARIEFRGTSAQKIATRLSNTTLYPGGYGNGTTVKYAPTWKAANYVNFPDIVVYNSNHVTIAPEISASVKGIDLRRGRLILDSRRLNETTDETGGQHLAASSSLLAHLYVDSNGTILYNRGDRGAVSTVNQYGAIDVKVALDESVDKTDTQERAGGRSIVGMGSPFEQIKGDYFFWNFLMFPYGNNIFGYWNNTITDPTTTIGAGQGFVVGIDLRGTVAANYTPYHKTEYSSADFDTRAKDGYSFGRFGYDNANNYYPLSGMTSATFPAKTVNEDAYMKENLNYKNVQRKLIKGFNYLANPFTTPLDLSDILDGTTTDWNVTTGEVSGDIYPYVWILNPSSTASGLYDGDGNSLTGYPVGMEKLYATYTYFLLRENGSTYESTDANNAYNTVGVSIENKENIIAPLQMFLVYSTVDREANQGIIIPASKRALGSGANFLRSASSAPVKYDDFLFEVTDQTTKAFDRTAVVLRSPDEIMNNSSYTDIYKTISSVSESDDVTSANLKTVTESGKVSKTVNSALYTTDSKGNALESKFLASPKGATEVSTPLYLSPSGISQNVEIKAKRLNTMQEVKAIILHDKLKNVDFELSSGEAYKAAVTSSDSHDRFNLRFLFSTSGIEDDFNDDTNKSITSYYANGELTVAGFEDSDIGSVISVYDVQGRMLRQAKVNESTMKITEVFYPGAYIVKVVGNKSYVSKFLVR